MLEGLTFGSKLYIGWQCFYLVVGVVALKLIWDIRSYLKEIKECLELRNN